MNLPSRTRRGEIFLTKVPLCGSTCSTPDSTSLINASRTGCRETWTFPKLRSRTAACRAPAHPRKWLRAGHERFACRWVRAIQCGADRAGWAALRVVQLSEHGHGQPRPVAWKKPLLHCDRCRVTKTRHVATASARPFL